MKKIFSFLLMATLVCSLGLGIVSCKDDDKEENGSDSELTNSDPTESDEAAAALRWLCTLTDTRELDANWAQKTYEPTVGQASTQNELNRLVIVTCLEEAQANFASLAGIGVEGLEATKTVVDQGVGKLTWTPSPEGADNIATVDVESSLLPRLRQIVYCTSEQTGKNGIFGKTVDGTAYYRFGDVVRDKEGYYWVCVRPCFDPDKGTSHWINIFNASESGGNKPIPDKYLQTKWNNLDKYKKMPIILPTKLPYEEMHTFNLSQLIQALLKPQEYEKVYKKWKYHALGYFEPKYNGVNFVKRVAEFWDQPVAEANNHTIWEILFNRTHTQMSQMAYLNFIHKGYSWKFGTKATVYNYSSGDYRVLYNTGNEYQFDVNEGIDVRWYTSDPNASELTFNRLGQFVLAQGIWVIRYATGKELNGGRFSPYEPLTNCTNIYVYNIKTNKNVRDVLETEDDLSPNTNIKALDSPTLGCIIGADGKFYANVSDAKAATVREPVAVVTCLNGTKRVETGTDFNGLAICLTPTGKEMFLEPEIKEERLVNDSLKEVVIQTSLLDCNIPVSDTIQGLILHKNGLACTKNIVNGCGHKHVHPAAVAAYKDIFPGNNNFSKSFIPASGQCILAMTSMGMSWDARWGYGYSDDWFHERSQETKDREKQEALNVQNKLASVGVTTLKNKYLWTVTAFGSDAIDIFMTYYYSGSMNKPLTLTMTEKRATFPFIAFKYGGGATED